MHEFEWIARYFAPLTLGRSEALNLTDDAAIISPPPGKQLIVTTDTINESVHFLPRTPAPYIAHKALATNLSDLAAKCATPYCYSLALCLPAQTQDTWLAAFCDSLAALQQNYGCFLLGGDTTRSAGGVSVTITAFGLAENPILRSGAQPGDALFATGSIGDAYCGLQLCKGDTMRHYVPDEHYLINRYHLPTPRLSVGIALTGIATACMDISDGLLQDAGHIARASHVGLRIEAAAVPISPAAKEFMLRSKLSPLDLFAGGDDYELLFTAPPGAAKNLLQIAAQTGIAITHIGEVVEGADVVLLDALGKPIAFDKSGWQHF